MAEAQAAMVAEARAVAATMAAAMEAAKAVLTAAVATVMAMREEVAAALVVAERVEVVAWVAAVVVLAPQQAVQEGTLVAESLAVERVEKAAVGVAGLALALTAQATRVVGKLAKAEWVEKGVRGEERATAAAETVEMRAEVLMEVLEVLMEAAYAVEAKTPDWSKDSTAVVRANEAQLVTVGALVAAVEATAVLVGAPVAVVGTAEVTVEACTAEAKAAVGAEAEEAPQAATRVGD
jgi:hypothetical protein